MRVAFAWIGTFLLFPLVGAPLLARPTFRRFPLGARVILSGAAGAAFVSFVMTAFALGRLRWSLPWTALAALLLAWLLSSLLHGGITPSRPANGRRTPAENLAVAFSALCVLAALAATLAGAATSIDLLFFWGPKAQQFGIARAVDVAFLADPSHGYMHAYYPPLVVNLEALATLAAGRFSWTAAMLTFPVLLGALALALPGVLRGVAPRPAAAAASALVVASLAVVGIRLDVAGNGDLPLLLFETLAMALLLRHDAAEPAVQLLAGLLLAGAAAAKVEGLAYLLAAVTLFLALEHAGPARSARAAARLLLPSFLALATWFAFGISRDLFYEYSEYGRFLDVHFEHGAQVLTALPRALFGAGWGLPYLIPLACVVAAGRPAHSAWLPLGTAAGLVLFLVFTYLHLADDPSDWIAWSGARVFMPVSMLLGLAFAATAGGAEASRQAQATSPR